MLRFIWLLVKFLIAGNDIEVIFQWNPLSSWYSGSHLGKCMRDSLCPCYQAKPPAFLFMQVLIAVVSNLIWYGSLAPSVQENEHISISLWRGFTVVISSLAIFGRLFFNSAQVRASILNSSCTEEEVLMGFYLVVGFQFSMSKHLKLVIWYLWYMYV